MTAKAAVLALAVLVSGIAAFWLQPHHPGRTVAAPQPEFDILPARLAGAPMVNEWHNQRTGTIIEDVAEYKPFTEGTGVMLAFFRGRPGEHNGINCLIARGERPVWQERRILDTASGPTPFVVAMLTSADRPRLVASTQCSATGCSQALDEDQRLGWLGRLYWGFKPRTQAALRTASVVPVTLIVTPTDSQAGASARDALLAALERAAGALDLGPARRLAVLQQGAPSRPADHLVDAHTLNPLRE